jgi:hypothetical protein
MKAKKARRGRPPKGSGEAKSQGVLLRLTPREKQVFSDAANIAGIPLSVWMRERLRRAAIRDMEEVGRAAVFLSEQD